MDRIYNHVINNHFSKDGQMVFLSGPRQVGKTTISQTYAKNLLNYYFNWDVKEHRAELMTGPVRIGELMQLTKPKAVKPVVIFDELHKFKLWRDFIKGFFDLYKNDCHIIVTGSAKFDIYRKGGDSLMGRYFPYRIHPLSVAELITCELPINLTRLPQSIQADQFETLWKYGGFPDPYTKNNKSFHMRWNNLRHQQLFEKDIRNFSHIQEIDQLEILALHLREQATQLLNYSNLAKKIGVSVNTIKRWIITLKNFYYCFTLKPWTKNVTRSLLKEPKVFLWDWSEITDEGRRTENFVACHLLKSVHFWEDMGYGNFELFFIRDKDKNEVDFLVTKEKNPWFLVEVKKADNQPISKALYHFQEKINAPHAFQVVFDLDFENIDCFSYKNPVIVPLQTFLSQLI